jgi:hypothetical protein
LKEKQQSSRGSRIFASMNCFRFDFWVEDFMV